MPRAESIPAVLLTVADVAKCLVVHDEVVLAHIRGGRLRAINVGLGSQRPRWRITAEALEEFLAARTPVLSNNTKHERKKGAKEVIEFF